MWVAIPAAQRRCGGEADVTPKHVVSRLPRSLSGYPLPHLSGPLMLVFTLCTLFYSCEFDCSLVLFDCFAHEFGDISFRMEIGDKVGFFSYFDDYLSCIHWHFLDDYLRSRLVFWQLGNSVFNEKIARKLALLLLKVVIYLFG